MTKDLGTYHVRVELKDGRGWIQEWTTGHSYTHGRSGWHPLNAQLIKPTYESDDDVLRGIEYAFTDGNYGCDCNKHLFIGYTEGKSYEDAGERECGDTLEIKRLVAIRPDLSEVVLIDEAAVSAGGTARE